MIQILDLQDIELLDYYEKYKKDKFIELEEKDQLNIFNNIDQYY